MSTAENSVRADLEAAIKSHAEPEEVETNISIIEGDLDNEPKTVTTTTETTQERARDEKGRFAAREAADAAADPVATKVVEPKAPTASAAAAQVDESKQAEQQPKTEAALAPPNGWSAEAKAKWHELSPEIMAAVQKREQDIAKFTSTRDEHASFGKEIYQTVQPYLATIKAEGGTPATAIESLLNTAYVLRTGSIEQKRQLLLTTARQYGVDLGAAAKPNGAQPTNTPPEIAALQQKVADLEGLLKQRDDAVHTQLQTETQTEIQAFAADPAHPHYELVKGHMAALIDPQRGGLCKTLQEAYDQAIWARPDLRATLLAQQRAEEEQKRRTDAKQKAEAARRKSVSITGGPGNTAASAAPGSKGSVRDDLLDALSTHAGGAV